MEFTHKFPEWQNEGVEPSESLAAKGFEVGNKPPATVFNWLFHKTGKAIDELQEALVSGAGIPIVVATSADGTAYTTEVPGITELYEGLTICLMPDRNSSVSQPTLDVNGLGAIRIGILSTFNNAGVVPAPIDTWLSANRPINVTYHTIRSTLTGEVTMQYWIADLRRPSASSLYGSVPVDSGGTGLDEIPVDSFLVGNGTEDMVTKTPDEARELMGAVTAEELFNSSYEVVKSYPSKAGLFALNGTDIFANMPAHNPIGVLLIVGAYNGLNIYVDNANRLYYGFSSGIKEPSAWHRPVQLGGGAGQLTNTVMIGWDGSYLKAQVDSVDLGSILTHRNLSYSNGTLNIETRPNT